MNGFPAPTVPAELLASLGLAGVLMHDRGLAWDVYPKAAAPSDVVTGGAADTYGTAVAFVAAEAITVPYRVVRIVRRNKSGGGDGGCRIQVRQTSDTARKRELRCMRQNLANAPGDIRYLVPLPIDAGAGVQVLMEGTAATLTDQIYVEVLIQEPTILPQATRAAVRAAEDSPGLVGAVSLTAHASAWTFGSYAELTAGFPTDVLITATWAGKDNDLTVSHQTAFATGPAGGERTPWGTFGTIINTYATPGVHSLRPYALYVPANTRVAAKTMASTGGTTILAGFDYIPLPWY